MKLYNYEIYEITIALIDAFQNQSSQILPIKLNYYIKKNLSNLRNISFQIEQCKKEIESVQEGLFGADMKVESINDGPVTIILDTDVL